MEALDDGVSYGVVIEQVNRLLESQTVTIDQLEEALQRLEMKKATEEMSSKLGSIRKSLNDRIDDERLDYQAVIEEGKSLLDDCNRSGSLEELDKMWESVNNLVMRVKTDSIKSLLESLSQQLLMQLQDALITQCQNLLNAPSVTMDQLEVVNKMLTRVDKKATEEVSAKFYPIRRRLDDRIEDERLDYQAVIEEGKSLLQDPDINISLEDLDVLLAKFDELLENLRTKTIRESLRKIIGELKEERKKVLSRIEDERLDYQAVIEEGKSLLDDCNRSGSLEELDKMWESVNNLVMRVKTDSIKSLLESLSQQLLMQLQDALITQCQNLLNAPSVTMDQLEVVNKMLTRVDKKATEEVSAKFYPIRRRLDDRIEDERLDYQAVIEEGKSLLQDPDINISLEDLDVLLAKFDELLENLRTKTIRESLRKIIGELKEERKKVLSSNYRISYSGRVADLDFDIQESTLMHTYDLRQFMAKVDELFTWHDHGSEAHMTYMAPYFPLVQSSGTGKTKLLYEAKMEYSKVSTGSDKNALLTNCLLINCMQQGQNSAIFTRLELPKLSTNEPTNKDRDNFYDILDKFLLELKGRVALFFDESQFLLQTHKAWYFRVIRGWLRIKRPQDVVAVFAGTTSALANYYREPPISTSSRDPKIYEYQGEGQMIWPPLFELTTTGLGANAQRHEDTTRLTDYDQAIPYGRILFARMHVKGILEENLSAVLLRMIQSQPDTWSTNRQICFGLLATRVQLGQVPFGVASSLIASGYAHLTHFSSEYHNTVDIAYLPDPVCAHLVMCLMRGTASLAIGRFKINGQPPKFWTKQATEMFTSSLCRPQKGGVGEVAAALYLLFCADKLRYDKCPVENGLSGLRTFSVRLEDWIKILSPGRNCDSSSWNVNLEVGFIQFCRHYLRGSLSDIYQNDMLEHWYKSGRAVYTHENCECYDMIIPLKCTRDTKVSYSPLLVSVKNRGYFPPGQRRIVQIEMMKHCDKAKCQYGAGMLLLLGGEYDADLKDPLLVTTPQQRKFFYFEIALPSDDPYGITALVRNSTIGGGERTEVYSSHADIFIVGNTPTESLLRVGRASDPACDAPLRMLSDLRASSANRNQLSRKRKHSKN